MHVGIDKLVFLELPVAFVPHYNGVETTWEGYVDTKVETFTHGGPVNEKNLVLTVRVPIELSPEEEAARIENEEDPPNYTFEILEAKEVFEEVVFSGDEGLVRVKEKPEFAAIIPWSKNGANQFLHNYPHKFYISGETVAILDVDDDDPEREPLEGESRVLPRTFIYVEKTPFSFKCPLVVSEDPEDDEESDFNDFGYFEIDVETYKSGIVALGKTFKLVNFIPPDDLLDQVEQFEDSLLSLREDLEDEGKSEQEIRETVSRANDPKNHPLACWPDQVFEFSDWFVKDFEELNSSQGEVDRVEYLVDIKSKDIVAFPLTEFIFQP